MNRSGRTVFYTLTQDMLNGEVPPDAIFATSDPKAIVVMKAVKDYGLRIPEELQVLGFDDIEISSMMDPPLSTVAQPLHEMGVQAAEKVIRMILNRGSEDTNPEACVDVLETELVIWKSTK